MVGNLKRTGQLADQVYAHQKNFDLRLRNSNLKHFLLYHQAIRDPHEAKANRTLY